MTGRPSLPEPEGHYYRDHAKATYDAERGRIADRLRKLAETEITDMSFILEAGRENEKLRKYTDGVNGFLRTLVGDSSGALFSRALSTRRKDYLLREDYPLLF